MVAGPEPAQHPKGWNWRKKTETRVMDKKRWLAKQGAFWQKETKFMKGLRESKMRAKINLEVSVTCFLHKPPRAVAWHCIIFLLKKCRIFYYKTTFLEEQLVVSPFCAPSNLSTVCRLLGPQEGSYELSLPKLYSSEKNIVLEVNNILKRFHVW